MLIMPMTKAEFITKYILARARGSKHCGVIDAKNILTEAEWAWWKIKNMKSDE